MLDTLESSSTSDNLLAHKKSSNIQTCSLYSFWRNVDHESVLCDVSQMQQMAAIPPSVAKRQQFRAECLQPYDVIKTRRGSM